MPFCTRGFCRPAAFSAVFGVLFVLLTGGCAERPVAGETSIGPRQARTTSLAPTSLNVAMVTRSPAYQKAVEAYRRKDFRNASARIDTLLRTGNISPSAEAFLNHQEALCQDAITGRTGAAAAASRASAGTIPTRYARSAADADCGPRALLLVCQSLKTPASLESLRKAAGTTAEGTTMDGLAKAAQSVGLKADGVQMDRNALSNLSKPAVFWVDGRHFIAVLAVHHSLMGPVNGDTADESSGFIATVHDPNQKGEEEMPLGGPTGLLAKSGGMLLLLSRENRIASAAMPTH